MCKKRTLKLNALRSKVRICAKTKRKDHLNLSLNGYMLEDSDSFKHLVSIYGGVDEDVIGRVNEGKKCKVYEQDMEGKISWCF